jgi:peptidoglycan/LPS O-acetylase OafA/YrhL
MRTHGNNFDVLRLSLAGMVVLAHCHDLSRAAELAWITRVISSRVAVEGFFAMSGYLIVASYERSSSLHSYCSKRARRILPAYWGALVFTVALGAALSTLSIFPFLRSPETWKYVAATLSFASFLHPTLPGVFASNPGVIAANGALWTIKVEIMFYLLVPGLVFLCRRAGRWRTLGLTFVASVCYRTACQASGHEALALQLPGQLAFFAIGALIHYNHAEFVRRGRWMWTIGGAAFLAHVATGGFGLRAVGIAVLTLCAALLAPSVEGPTRWGDFSYGIYVTHFPIVQACVALGCFRIEPYFGVAVALVCVAAVAAGSWFGIERRWLNRTPAATNPCPAPASNLSPAA